MRPYPTRNGLAVPTCEVDLPESRLNLRNPKNFNNHHLEFSRRTFGKSALLMTLRDLEFMQEALPMDVHNMGRLNLHNIYSPPKLPTPRQAMDRIDQAYETDERLKIWNAELKQYEYHTLTSQAFKSLKREYYKTR